MTVTGGAGDTEVPDAVQFCVDWQLEAAAGAVTASPRPAALPPPDTVPLPSEPMAAPIQASTSRRRRST